MRAALSAVFASLLIASANAQGDGPSVVAAEEALRNVHLAPLDPSPLDAAEVASVLGDGPRCTFHYTSTGGPPVLAVGLEDGAPTEAILKLNGKLVRLAPAEGSTAPAASGGFTVVAESVRATIEPLQGAASGEPEDATMMFSVGDALKAGYGGYFVCLP